MISTRTDGRGHWPRGKRRNADAGEWSRLRLRLTRLLADHWRAGRISAAAAARAVGVDSRTLRRWLSGEDRPSAESQQALAGWIAEVSPRRSSR